MTEEQLDLRGLKCPLPVLHTRKLLGRLPAGASATVLCNDPLSAIDIPHLLQETANELVMLERDGEVLRFTIRRRG